MDIFALLRQMKIMTASDLYIKVGIPPGYRVNGSINKSDLPPISDEDMDKAAHILMTDHQARLFKDKPDLDFAYTIDTGERFRINLFRQQGHIGMAARCIQDEDLSFEALGLPPVIQKFSELPRGLVLLTGATGSGKSTTLAAMISHINQHFSKHVMTIEDPIEFVYKDNQSIINQREIGYDTQNFHDALRHVVRQSPDVILIGEMRDSDTMMTAISAAETGHLVLSTLHTTDVVHTLDRIINYFPDHMKAQVREEMALSLEGIVGMRLLPRTNGEGRVPAMEILSATPLVRKLLRQGEHWSLPEVMQKGKEFGMQTFNQSLLQLYKQDLITYDDAMLASSNPEEFKLNSQGMFTGTDSISFYQTSEDDN
ncbi:MAG: PilT/PilU family type 4a pilus ATPase [Candidatus Hinthialibacter antarcticus]|nr:PilT/PilU family type 4a pilus ATPase [Candidatus Hinthialibacter antarcticus]